ncbi:MAG TPA: FAD-linked oxidase C-terminal domain-containing protein, partial [Acidimicrobiales bacterium]|nr:FAD-linked oxidase C-terminal domain-containing protein [Acidimicrobiales bacterium]
RGPAGAHHGAVGQGHLEAGLEACRRVLRRGATPAVLRLYDHQEAQRGFGLDTAVLVVLDEGDEAIVTAMAAVVDEECRAAGAEALDEALVGRWLEHRNDVSILGKAIETGLVVDTCEVAARWSALPGLYRAAVAALREVPGAWVGSAHQSHAYTDGACLYFTFAGQPPEPGGGDAFYAAAWQAVMDATLAAGGAVSHHHGIGLNRARFLAASMGPAFGVLASVKAALDPQGILNPGKLGLPSPFGPALPW